MKYDGTFTEWGVKRVPQVIGYKPVRRTDVALVGSKLVCPYCFSLASCLIM